MKLDEGAVLDAETGEVDYVDAGTEKPVFVEDLKAAVSVSESAPSASAPTITPPAAPQPAKTEPKKENQSYNKVKAVEGFLKLAGLEPKQLLDFLSDLGAIDKDITEIKGVPADVIDMVEEQHSSIFAKIKEGSK